MPYRSRQGNSSPSVILPGGRSFFSLPELIFLSENDRVQEKIGNLCGVDQSPTKMSGLRGNCQSRKKTTKTAATGKTHRCAKIHVNKYSKALQGIEIRLVLQGVKRRDSLKKKFAMRTGLSIQELDRVPRSHSAIRILERMMRLCLT